MEDATLDIVACAILVLMTHAWDLDANIPTITAHAMAVVSTNEICERMSHENNDNK
jgi:hypothetical protein